ncbi:MAG TPA: TlpA disulfide reductase family protein [Candidatus Baltobacteraceae bacterium]|jgi:peroxiredoxin|nr:TlpA disulfide reductase family protein [Candidatus Baltobacteraceae bacterium]
MLRAALPTLATVALLTGCASATHGRSASSAPPPVARIGQPAPEWTEPAVPSGTLSLASLHGKAVYLNFFASWCPPCNEEAPTLNALQKQFGGRGLQVVGVDVLENSRKAEQFRSDHSLTYPAIVDDGTLRNQYNVNGLPVHVFIDRGGVVRDVVVGELSASDMRAHVLKLLR